MLGKKSERFVTPTEKVVTHPAILVKYARKGVPESTTGSWIRISLWKRREKA